MSLRHLQNIFKKFVYLSFFLRTFKSLKVFMNLIFVLLHLNFYDCSDKNKTKRVEGEAKCCSRCVDTIRDRSEPIVPPAGLQTRAAELEQEHRLGWEHTEHHQKQRITSLQDKHRFHWKFQNKNNFFKNCILVENSEKKRKK